MIEHIFPVHPAAIFILGALVIPLLKGRLKQIYLVTLPVVAFVNLLYLPHGVFWVHHIGGFELIFGRVDSMSLPFGYIFIIMAFLGALYAIHLKGSGEHVAAFILVGASLGAVFAGDYISLYLFLAMMTFSSAPLIFYRRRKSATGAGFRYIMFHLFGGSLLLAGIVLHYTFTGHTHFGPLESGGLYFYLVMIGFLVKAAVPPFHAWLSDAYPEGTATGSVFLSAFTTKVGVYVLIRAFAGADILIWLGAIMAVYGVVYAVIENDGRRLLAYHIISQVGYMVAGVGMGTQMAINGAIAHAFCHILYKALLFMGPGAVLYVTGKEKLTELGGLYKTMPITLILFMVGGLSISAVPLFNGFVSKSMIVAAAGLQGEAAVYILLVLASVGTFLHTCLKLPYYTFFARDAGIEAQEPPRNMLMSMGITAFLCLFIGIYPAILYNILPYPVDFVPYTIEKVVEKIALLSFTFLGFWLLKDKIAGQPTISLDTDWFYRKAGTAFMWFCRNPALAFAGWVDMTFARLAGGFLWFCRNPASALATGVDSMFAFVVRIFVGRQRHSPLRALKSVVGWMDRLSLAAEEAAKRRAQREKMAALAQGEVDVRGIDSALFLVALMLALFLLYLAVKYLW
ncbi:Na(+)/H(+) antiporter subunit D [Dehalococcoidia bacterium]|nr:Na(+)/H(+) antiporter subunit D [Dehalococcoidia bacterium]MCL0080055.1 Na(+)/H(+) antiporter subunit D [Dehalococcoidia bacterium]MCL0097917.1 Na(+)/H(+) antiporter subunit D [Dehalococcoidia bacterium]